jgi:hypothetical protein
LPSAARGALWMGALRSHTLLVAKMERI